MPIPAALDEVHWSRTAAPAPEALLLEGDITADVIVVGGGLSGTRTALGLAESGAKVALLEAKRIGWGASGRSGGQCNPIWRATPQDLAGRLGDACANRLVRATLTSADDLFADIRRYDIDCDAEQNGWVQAAHCKSEAASLIELAEAWNAVGGEIGVLEGPEVAKVSGSEAYRFALFHKRGGHVQPLSLTRGFARAAEKHGAQLYENASVRSMSRVNGKWKVATSTGSVTARQVILTTNAYTNGLWPGLQQTFFPMVSISLATAPLSDSLQQSVLPADVTISDSRRAIYYARYDRDKRLIFGCVGSNDSVETLGGIKRLQRGLDTVFPQLKNTPIETVWAGRIAVTPEMMPHLHEPDEGVLAALGFSGRGIAMTSVMAKGLVHKTMGGSEEDLPFPVTPIKRIPFHWAATKMLPLAAPAMTIRDSLDGILGRK
ncbi:FAD-binding oxidoreductase [uncultured Ruegeria sp.]|uniref:NAD(P)/FAD-dependent oxidoreductase n=1 Tax=uncultured Ruegeria sp. TaxID=259304 RepID=UPI0026325CBE|nr:FAD-binding oxidoreductase [uncultured Ruegeria sp.]